MKKLLIVITAIFALATFSTATFAASVDEGKALFNDKKKAGCKVCHKITAKKLVGPGLKGVGSKHTDEWMKAWIKDPQGVWKENNAETAKMKKRLKRTKKKKTKMKLKKSVKLTDDSIDSLVMYLKTL